MALHRLGITLKCVVSAEICKENRLILKSLWEKTQQKGKLIEVEDVQNLADKELEDLIDLVGGFDLIIGGSPCNNLTSNNNLSPISDLVVKVVLRAVTLVLHSAACKCTLQPLCHRIIH